MPEEVALQWNQRSCFGGFMGKVRQLNTLPATEEDIFTTIGNSQLAKALVESGPVMRAQIDRAEGSAFDHRWLPPSAPMTSASPRSPSAISPTGLLC
jgi:HlyD family secretion protein